jgi:Fic family protein
LRISPLMVLNKITIIALTDYLLYKNNYLQSTFIPISRNFDIYEDEYIEAWNSSIQGKLNPETGEVHELEDLTLWLERFTRNLSHDILEVREIFNRKIGDDQKSIKQPFLDLNKRQLKILRYLQTIPTVKREDYIQMMDVSTMTAFRDLNQLVKKKLLKIEGKGRGTKYMLSSR